MYTSFKSLRGLPEWTHQFLIALRAQTFSNGKGEVKNMNQNEKNSSSRKNMRRTECTLRDAFFPSVEENADSVFFC
jgi:hypothetical protein